MICAGSERETQFQNFQICIRIVVKGDSTCWHIGPEVICLPIDVSEVHTVVI